ncbi:Uncharacterised protein [Vibrio cholerae]|nr:Uncharacterised protein [Vibrio cholerae]CSC52693.1 Uncharacterised protein [Vibrio cholerae]CSI28727.1 Uncharacterised protein [Vibrio cholerae]
MTINTTHPKSRGSQPPSINLVEVDANNKLSMPINTIPIVTTRGHLHCH